VQLVIAHVSLDAAFDRKNVGRRSTLVLPSPENTRGNAQPAGDGWSARWLDARKPGEAKKAVADADFVPKPKVVKTGTDGD
jgi:hypothetical protein